MKSFNTPVVILFVSLSASFGFAQAAQGDAYLAGNAALRYWSAFSQIQDTALTDQEAIELNAILDGTARYDDSKYKELLQKNALALEVMRRGTSLRRCNWGLDYGLGSELPVEYARKALALGRLNTLYVFHLFAVGDKDGAVQALVAGLKFSQDVGNGGSLFATLVAKDLLVKHLRLVTDSIQLERLSDSQRSRLQHAVTELGDGLDWQGAAKRDLESLRSNYAAEPHAWASMTRIITSYVAVIGASAKLPALNDAIKAAPLDLASLIPSAQRVLDQRQELRDQLQKTKAILQ